MAGHGARDFLLEIGTEELPWGAVRDGRAQLRDNLLALLERERLAHGEIRIYSTPRRLAALVEDLAEKQADYQEMVKGPRRAAAFDEKGNPTAAAEGFARARGVRVEDLEIRETDKGEFVFAVVREEGRETLDILPGLVEEVLRSFSFRKSMRWGEGEFRFARPVRWLVALYGEEVVTVEFEGLRAGRTSRGHRFLSPGEVEVAVPRDYPDVLRRARVMADEEERRRAILRGMEEALSSRGLRAVPAGETLDEVVDLVEYPHVILGRFEERFLELPREVLETAMQEHQRYFPVEGEDGRPAPAFLVVHNGDPDKEETIRRGHERVLRARLEDASFFYQEDLERTLEERLPDLKSVVWQARLGSLYDKSQRLVELCGEICRSARLPEETAERARRAALLCKADLVTSMVVEFTSLQGVMGRIYALAAGEDAETAAAIEEHYLPRFAGDRLPETLPGAVLCLAEKVDNLCGCFGVGLVPSGSEDPYALRRQAVAVLSVLAKAGLHLDFSALLAAAAGRFGFSRPDVVAAEVSEFCRQRWRQALIGEGFDYDLVAAVLDLASRDPYEARLRLEALQEARGRGLLQRAYTGFERCHNLSARAEVAELDVDLLVEDAERNLYSKLTWAQEPLRGYLDAGEYKAALKVLLDLTPDIDRFFDEIFVMGEDARLRDNRLALLKKVASLFLEFADFTQVVTEGER
ncbi:MAG: glycine--tRNA ligase subunit beta [Actinobacteria bacterium]|nr:glycine--tRNA ligase subunit beta [Actinomycetota bacterium]